MWVSASKSVNVFIADFQSNNILLWQPTDVFMHLIEEEGNCLITWKHSLSVPPDHTNQ